MEKGSWTGSRRRGSRSLATTVWMLAAAQLVAAPLAAVQVTQDEALRLVFPEPATIERRTAFLDESQLVSVRELAGPDVSVEQRVVTYYVATAGDSTLGAAYFDAHRVRTLPEVLMIVVAPEGRVRRIEILRFSEPPEYEAPRSWLEQFRGKPLSDDLSLKGSIVNITGATLTSRAVTNATRRILSIHSVVRPFDRAPARER